jgi:erythromycin esterase
MDRSQANQEEAIRTWLQQSAIPIRHVEAGNGFADLQPLKAVLQDVKILGAGEATHGTREFFQFKHRLLEFLVTEMGFTLFALEASSAACEPINDYVRYGKGDLTDVVTGQGYLVWDTEEITEMVEWLRRYNQSVSEEKKVSFYGVDLTNNARGRPAILDYLRQIDSPMLTATEENFQTISRYESKVANQTADEGKAVLREALQVIHALIEHLAGYKGSFSGQAEAIELEAVLHSARLIQQWVLFMIGEGSRSQFMAENLLYLVDHKEPNAKCVVWQHNSHISKMSPATGGQNIGNLMREEYGDRYYALSLEFNQGAYQARELLPGSVYGDLIPITLPPAPAGTLPWYLADLNMGSAFVNLRTQFNDPVVEEWFKRPQGLYLVGWIYDESKSPTIELSLSNHYDGLVCFERTTPARPTENALSNAAQRVGL